MYLFSIFIFCTHFLFSDRVFIFVSNSISIWHQFWSSFCFAQILPFSNKINSHLSHTRNSSSPSSTPHLHNPPKPNHNSINTVAVPHTSQGVPRNTLTWKKFKKKKLYLIHIRNTLNHKIRNTLEFKKKKKIICSSFKPKKKKKTQKKIWTKI